MNFDLDNENGYKIFDVRNKNDDEVLTLKVKINDINQDSLFLHINKNDKILLIKKRENNLENKKQRINFNLDKKWLQNF